MPTAYEFAAAVASRSDPRSLAVSLGVATRLLRPFACLRWPRSPYRVTPRSRRQGGRFPTSRPSWAPSGVADPAVRAAAPGAPQPRAPGRLGDGPHRRARRASGRPGGQGMAASRDGSAGVDVAARGAGRRGDATATRGRTTRRHRRAHRRDLRRSPSGELHDDLADLEVLVRRASRRSAVPGCDLRSPRDGRPSTVAGVLPDTERGVRGARRL